MPEHPATRPEWAKVAAHLDGTLMRLWADRFKSPEAFTRQLHDMRTTEMYKDIGYDSWMDYTNSRWGRASFQVRNWERCMALVHRFPSLFKLAPAGIVPVDKVADMTPFVWTREDIIRWRSLAMFTTRSEWRDIIEAATQAMRCGLPTRTSVLVVAFVDGDEFQTYVQPALDDTTRKQRHKDQPLGRTLSHVCARALGKPIPSSLGLDAYRPRPTSSKTYPARLVGGVGGEGEGGKT